MDIYLNNEFDITISPSGDIEIVKNYNEVAQYISIALNEDTKKGLITIYPTNLSEFNGTVIDEDTINEIQSRISSAIHSVVADVDIEFKKPIVTNDQKLFLPLKILYDGEPLYQLIIRFTSDKVYVNYVN